MFGGDRDVLVNNIAWILRRMPVFALPGSGSYPVQPVHVDDLARICEQSTHIEGDAIMDAAGPQTMTFEELVRAIRRAIRARSPILHLPPTVMSAASRALGLLVSHDAPLGRIAFSEWLGEHSDSIGSVYANELQRHFVIPAAHGEGLETVINLRGWGWLFAWAAVGATALTGLLSVFVIPVFFGLLAMSGAGAFLLGSTRGHAPGSHEPYAGAPGADYPISCCSFPPAGSGRAVSHIARSHKCSSSSGRWAPARYHDTPVGLDSDGTRAAHTANNESVGAERAVPTLSCVPGEKPYPSHDVDAQ